MILPALTLSVVGVANVALHTREKTIDIMESDTFGSHRLGDLLVCKQHVNMVYAIWPSCYFASICFDFGNIWRISFSGAGFFLFQVSVKLQ